VWPTARGEAQQTVVDVVGTALLRERSGASGFVNDVEALGSNRPLDEVLNDLGKSLDSRGARVLNEWRDPKNSPYRHLPVNDPRRLQLPPMTGEEIAELRRRGVEFYSQVAKQVNEAKGRGEVGDGPTSYPGVYTPVNNLAAYIHQNPDKITIKGGYSRPGTLPFGPIEQFMQMPTEPEVDEGRARHHFVEVLRERSRMERQFILSKSDKLPGAPVWMSQEDYLKGLHEARERAKKWGAAAADEYEQGVRVALTREVPGYPTMLVNDGWPLVGLKEHDRWVRNWVDSGHGQRGSARMWEFRLKVNGTALPGRSDDAAAAAAALNAITDARSFGQVREAIRGGAVRAATLAGAVPLLDPEAWRELGKGNVGAAAQRVATQAAAGIASSPVIGAVTGVAQRVAPAVVPRLLAGANIVGIATAPVAAVQAYSGFLEGSTGTGLKEHWQRLRYKAAGTPPSAMRDKKEYSEGWITVPGKGRRWRDSEGNFFLEQPGPLRATGADTARQVIPQLFPRAVSVPANTPTGVAEIKPLRSPPSLIQRAQERLSLARESLNPAKGEWGLSELLFGR
jgi:hypothetical protein